MEIKREWIFLGLIVFVLFNINQNVLPKESVATIEGQECSLDKDCPCWGKYNVSGTTDTAYGLGVAKCIDCSIAKNTNRTACIKATTPKACDTTWCIDVEPVAEWTRDNPWKWLRDNPLVIFGLLGLIVAMFFLPKK